LTAEDLVTEALLEPSKEPDDDYVQYAESIRIAIDLTVNNDDDKQPHHIEDYGLAGHIA
jgi:hypothetical protein